MLQLFRFFRDEKGLEKTDIYYQAHVYRSTQRTYPIYLLPIANKEKFS